LNTHPTREQTTLKELQRSTTFLSNPAKQPMTLHAVELPSEFAQEVGDRGLLPLCIRYYDDAVREVGSQVIYVSHSGLVSDALTAARKHNRPEWGITGPLRVLEVVESRLHKLFAPDAMVRSMACFSKSNIFYHCLRVESDIDAESMPDGHKLIEIFHCDRQSQQAFAQPLLLTTAPGEPRRWMN